MSKALKNWETSLSTTLRGGIMVRICSLGRQGVLLRREILVAGDSRLEPASNGVDSRLVFAFEYSSDSSSLRHWIWKYHY